ncbi:replicative DNA helicase [Heliophilum fasciatum]|uniref:Replicative DNA helicase n=1 Tax=Heliophilum fasciatum TaxID=35700 RepID=A0A4R2RLM4_9FIRM|nr:replicative DNA helicase [Heliophilum fasciatum]MCW2278229.1 replicative DNA helicase [Heliophilum fasciatum]TCP63854.1 primary replicative DNA helicase [Heliophilum fasciatum]
MSNLFDRLPPQNVEAEQSVLGSMLLDAEAVNRAMELLKPEDFYKEAHQLIFRHLVALSQRNQPIDLVTVTEALRQSSDLERVGSIPYLIELGNVVPTSANVEHYAKIVAEKSLLRQIISTATRITQKGYAGEEEVDRLLDEAEQAFLAIAQRQARDGVVVLRDVLVQTLDHIEKLYNRRGDVTGVATHYRDLDRMTAGLQPSDLIIVAARPAMGKTAFCLNIAQNAAVHDKTTVALFSLEMSREQLVQRMLSSEALIDQQRLRTGALTEQDWDALTRAITPLSEAPIYIDDTAGITVMEMRAKCRRLKLEKNLGLVVIDYLQLMQGSGGKRSENRQQEISDISRSLKALARELHVPVVALSQLSRSVEQTTDKKPNLSHLRESGALEQDADVVMFIYREDYYFPETENKGIAEIIVAKHRNGPVGSVELGFLREYTKFLNREYA